MTKRKAQRSNADQVILTRKDLFDMGIDVGDSSLLRWEYYGRFPRRIKLSGTRVAWLKSEVDEWIKDRAAERAQTHYADPT